MRILHLDTERAWRGGQTQLRRLVCGGGADHVVAVPVGAPLAAALRDDGVAVHELPLRGRFRGTAALHRLVRRIAPDGIAVHTSHALAHVDRLRLRAIVHRRVDFVPSRTSRRRFARSRGVIAVSGAIARILRERGFNGPMRVVYDGVPVPEGHGTDVRAGLGIAADTPLVVSVGALVPHKGHVHLVRALQDLPGVHVAILGQGPLRQTLQRIARRTGSAARCHLVGPRSDVGDWLRAADVVAHPSVGEGLGSAVIEALRAGCAVVATRAGGIPEVVEGSGLLVPPGRVDALTQAIRRVLADPGPWRAAARRAAPRLQSRDSPRAMVQGTLDAYDAFLG